MSGGSAQEGDGNGHKPREGSIKGVRRQRKRGITSPCQVTPEWRQEEEDEESGLLLDAASVTSRRHKRKKFSKILLRYPRISKHAPLLSVPLGKPPYFDGEGYCMWSDKMRHHLTSLHASIWDLVEFGAQVPTVGDEGMTRLRSPKSGTLTPKPLLYSSPLYVERSIIMCKG
jgi:hypothetical protein